MYIGDVYIPNVADMQESEEGNVEEIAGLGLSRPVTVTHPSNLPELTLEGTLYKPASTVKTAEQYAEDLRALLRNPAYNYINFASRVGFLAPRNVPKLDRRAASQLMIPYSLPCIFHPDSQFQRRLRSNPEILTNDFSLAFGVGGCDSYIPLPIGATYSGGDGSSITRAGKDGTVTLVKANTSNNINFDLSADEVNVGGCKVWDSVVAGDTNEANWIQVFNKDHKFTGDYVLENGLIRFIMSPGASYNFYIYVNSIWEQVGTLSYWQPDNYTHRYFYVKLITPDKIVAEWVGNSPTGKQMYLEYIVERGKYYIERNVLSKSTGISDFRVYNSFSNPLRRFSVNVTDGDVGDYTLADFTAYDDSDGYALKIDTSVNHIGFAAIPKIPKLYNRRDASASTIYPTVNSGNLPYKVFAGAIPFTYCANLFKECEAMSLVGGATADYTGTDASPKTGTTGVTLNAYNEKCEYGLDVGTDIPLGTYRVFARAKDSNQVTSDFGIYVYNTTDSVYVIDTSKTLTNTFAYYYSDVTIGSAESGDRIQFGAKKRTSSTNTIIADYILIVPLTLDSKNGPQDIARQALVSQNLVRDLIQR